MTCIERIKNECKSRHIPISRLEKDCGFANGYIGKLREGTMPADRLLLVSKYLGLSYEFLITGERALPFDENRIVFHSVNLEERDLILAYRRADDATKQIIRKILDMDLPAEKRNESIS